MQRSTFLKNAATVSAFTILKPNIVFKSRLNSAIRLGIIGCGKRGTAVDHVNVAEHQHTYFCYGRSFRRQIAERVCRFTTN